MTVYRGLAAAPGIAKGPAWIFQPEAITVATRTTEEPEAELERLQQALATAREQLRQVEAETREAIGADEAAIFAAQGLFLQDEEFLSEIEEAIRIRRMSAAAAVEKVSETYVQALAALSDEYLSERAADVRDVATRVLRILTGAGQAASSPEEPSLILAEDLTPAETVHFERRNVLGLATVRGGPTSHTAVLARSLDIPAVVGADIPLQEIVNGTCVIVDGSAGTVDVDPSPDAVGRAERKRALWLQETAKAAGLANAPAVTRDGQRVKVMANIASVEEAALASQYGADGVGLLRTEFLYLNRERLPDEKEQAATYRAIFEQMGDLPIIVRTLDVGGDKPVAGLTFAEEANPFLGWRGIRMTDERPDLLRTQLRALLRAGAGVDLRIMIPFVSNLEEIRKVGRLLQEAQSDLHMAPDLHSHAVQLGMMIEVPSAALLADRFAREVDFFSVGSNDLTQYTLAVDRTNARVAHIGSPFHPAVLKLMKQTVDAAHACGKPVGICGEMAADPLAIPLLVGLDLDELSMSPPAIPRAKALIRDLNLRVCTALAEQALALSTTEEVKQLLHDETAYETEEEVNDPVT